MSSRDDAWSAIEAAFDEALLLPSAEHAAFLDRLDPSIRGEVAALLATHQSEDAAFEKVVGAVAGAWQDAATNEVATTLVGRRISAYTITAIAGQGGMGAVYRARRDDGQFEQDVAIKLVRHGYESAAAVERFRQERQILARLTHSGVARLLDGGAALDEAGREVPYLVMEFVEGRSITSYCRDGALTVRQRLDLFQQVCAAVQHAHQQLIVHRDLKPANILVTADGQVKLLDFGIAKLIAEDTPQMTRVGAALLTPAYASPEQVTGAPITVATDVYALGLILYEMLTGQQAQQVTTDSAVELTRVVCDTAATRPSQAVRSTQPDAGALARQLDGDLDTIVLKAIQKDPARRYTSVEQFADDIRRHIDGRPVLARPDAVGYRAGKFLRRHRVATAAAVLVLVTLIGALIVTTREAAARAAEARRADQRFADVRKLANTFLFQFHDEIADLPGSTKARALVVNTASEYLQSLAKDAAGDASLQLELALAYERLADIQGGVGIANVGESRAATASLTSALALAEALQTRGDHPTDIDRLIVRLHLRFGEAAIETGDSAAAFSHLSQALTLALALRAKEPASDRNALTLMSVYNRRGDADISAGDPAAAQASLEQAVTIARDLLNRAADANRARARSSLAGCLARLGGAQRDTGHVADSARTFRESIELFSDPALKAPATDQLLALVHADLARTLYNGLQPDLRQRDDAIANLRMARALSATLTRNDPRDVETQVIGANIDAAYAELLGDIDHQGADRLFRDVEAREARLISADPSRQITRVNKAHAEVRHAALLIRMERRDDAAALLRLAMPVLAAAGETEAPELIRATISAGDLAAIDRRPADAQRRYREALAGAESFTRRRPNLVAAQALVADAQARLADLLAVDRQCAEAATLRERSQSLWRSWVRDGIAPEWAAQRLKTSEGVPACAAR